MGNEIKFEGYFDNVFEPGFIDKARKILDGIQFDTCVGTGLSGTIGATILARGLRKHLAIVRKADDNSTHSTRELEGVLGSRWLFVDDIISLGRTRKRVLSVVDKEVARWNHHRNDQRESALYYVNQGRAVPEWLNHGQLPPVVQPHTTTFVGSYLYQFEGYFEAPDEI